MIDDKNFISKKSMISILTNLEKRLKEYTIEEIKSYIKGIKESLKN